MAVRDRGPLRTTATLLSAVVIMADLANTRRAAWLVFAVGFMVLAAVGFSARPAGDGHQRSGSASRWCSPLSPRFWNNTGGLAQPARAVRSHVAPIARDVSSDLYRIQEDDNL